MEVKFGDKYEAAELLAVSPKTLARYRKEHWIEGLHFVVINSRNIRYNLTLIEDWIKNKHEPYVHLKTLERYNKIRLGKNV